ncbi:restriction endonuclease [Candidatus Nitrosarchaeum limnium SFB1]|jgi:hypothetical protein|uniref:type II site-specific deoxyribonuclease n=1 Tax=Candidatus Nitrosarchaeum limnium SFB1 TaxID=886738 RepID=F3KLB8_9ARCH|nr:restriction endonuclease [Candidatus Nitrosarchaeum limnium SFB1]
MSDKIKKYSRETTSMPFLSRLMQDDGAVASMSLLISLSTTLGMSLYEQLAIILTENHKNGRAVKLSGGIDPKRTAKISKIMIELRNGTRTPNKNKEIEEILSIPNENPVFQKEGNIVDFYFERDEQEYYFEIKTVKPNIDVFTASKKKMLEWVAKKDKKIKSIVALPYNPYAPQPYERFTEQNIFDKKEEFLIGEKFWNFLGGNKTYEQLLEIFDRVGKEHHSKLTEIIKNASKSARKI